MNGPWARVRNGATRRNVEMLPIHPAWKNRTYVFNPLRPSFMQIASMVIRLWYIVIGDGVVVVVVVSVGLDLYTMWSLAYRIVVTYRVFHRMDIYHFILYVMINIILLLLLLLLLSNLRHNALSTRVGRVRADRYVSLVVVIYRRYIGILSYRRSERIK